MDREDEHLPVTRVGDRKVADRDPAGDGGASDGVAVDGDLEVHGWGVRRLGGRSRGDADAEDGNDENRHPLKELGHVMLLSRAVGLSPPVREASRGHMFLMNQIVNVPREALFSLIRQKHIASTNSPHKAGIIKLYHT